MTLEYLTGSREVVGWGFIYNYEKDYSLNILDKFRSFIKIAMFRRTRFTSAWLYWLFRLRYN